MSIDKDDQLKLLFTRIARGDEAAFDQIFKDWYDPVYSTALVYVELTDEASDVCQQIFLRLWEKRFDLDEVDDPKAWLLTAARNQAISAFKKAMTRIAGQETIIAKFYAGEEGPEERLVNNERSQSIGKAVADLPPKQREIYRLSREEGQTYAEIAQQMGLTHGAVKESMAQALRTLRQWMQLHKNDLISWLLLELTAKNIF